MTDKKRWVKVTLWHCGWSCNCYKFEMKNSLRTNWSGKCVENPKDVQWQLMVKDLCELIGEMKNQWDVTISDEVDDKIIEYGSGPCDFFNGITIRQEVDFETED